MRMATENYVAIYSMLIHTSTPHFPSLSISFARFHFTVQLDFKLCKWELSSIGFDLVCFFSFSSHVYVPTYDVRICNCANAVKHLYMCICGFPPKE